MDARAAVNVLGIASITGPAESWLIATHDSFSSIEAVDKAIRSLGPVRTADPMELPGDMFAVSRSLIAFYRPAFSYRAEQAIGMFPRARYVYATIYRIRPGAEPEFAELVKSRRGALDSINMDRPEIAYQVISGAASGTYLFLAPLTSLKSLDDGMAKAPAYVESGKTGSSEINRIHFLFRVEPGMSYVSDEFASADAEFWRSKAQ